MHAHSVPLPDSGEAGRFCQRCHKLQPLGAFTGTKRTCDAALLLFNRKRRAQQHGQAAAHPGVKGEACAAALARPLRDADEAVPPGLEATLRKRLGSFAGSLRMKTGTLDDTRALAGYWQAPSGQRLVIVAVVNSPRASELTPALDAAVSDVIRRYQASLLLAP